MNQQLKNMLEQQLRDVQTPDAIGWWPLAIGWWALLALVIVGLSIGLIMLSKYRKRMVHRKIAVTELSQQYIKWQAQQQTGEYLQVANALIKRACSHFDNHAVNLSGKAWVEYLNTHSKTAFSEECEAALSQQLYQENPSANISSLHPEITHWLLTHTTASVPRDMSVQGDQHA